MTDPAHIIAITLIRVAYEHLPADRAAGAIKLANLDPIAAMVTAITTEAYAAGLNKGILEGRKTLEKEMEDDWKPLAEKTRARAGSPSYRELENRFLDTPTPEYRGGPVEAW